MLESFHREVKHIPGVKNQVVDAASSCPVFRRVQCNPMGVQVTAAGEWIDDIKTGIFEHERFETIEQSSANPNLDPLPSTKSTKELKL
jgi:hypothetical protein